MRDTIEVIQTIYRQPGGARIIVIGKTKHLLRIGDSVPEGPNSRWIFGGSCDNGLTPLYIAPKDIGPFTWDEAVHQAGEHRARLPSIAELNHIFRYANVGGLRGSFDADAETKLYWSASTTFWIAAQASDLESREATHMLKRRKALARLVRTGQSPVI